MLTHQVFFTPDTIFSATTSIFFQKITPVFYHKLSALPITVEPHDKG
jgi:hypothetical protein